MEQGSDPGMPDEINLELAPLRRQNDLLVTDLPDETLVYDRRNDTAHVLNATTAFVWRECDGKRPVAEIATDLERALGVSATSSAVWLALEQLQAVNLLELRPDAPGVTLSRRTLLRVVPLAGLAAAAPALVSLVAPLPAAAASPAGCYVCPSQDNAAFPLGPGSNTGNPLFCSYPAFGGENPNDFYCTYNTTTGVLVTDHDAGFCPATAVNNCAVGVAPAVTWPAGKPPGAPGKPAGLPPQRP